MPLLEFRIPIPVRAAEFDVGSRYAVSGDTSIGLLIRARLAIQEGVRAAAPFSIAGTVY